MSSLDLQQVCLRSGTHNPRRIIPFLVLASRRGACESTLPQTNQTPSMKFPNDREPARSLPKPQLTFPLVPATFFLDFRFHFLLTFITSEFTDFL